MEKVSSAPQPKKKRRVPILLLLIVLAGLALLLYPSVSDYINSLGYRKTIDEYRKAVEEIDDNTYDEILQAAYAYNDRLYDRALSLLALPDALRADYESQLDTLGSGLMGYITIPAIDLNLPIYHGTDEAVLQAGVGHLEGSSLPVGGANTHSVLSAHTGLPSSKLFTNIDRLVEGDTFTIHILREEITYQVDNIQVVEPNELDSLRIEPGADLCTLVTCTPYGVNTHRLLVRGHRIASPDEEPSTAGDRLVIPRPMPGSDVDKLKPLIPVAIFFAVGLFIVLMIRIRRTRDDE